MVATRASRLEHLAALSTSVPHRLVDLTAADMEPLSEPNDALENDGIPVDVDMDASADVSNDVDYTSAKCARGSNRPASSPACVPLHPATSDRTATPRSFAPIPHLSSPSARAGKTPTRILSRQTGLTADPILPEDPKNFLEAP
ncbi:hypothetical protein H310_15075, partial [Aphanomyces invadans]